MKPLFLSGQVENISSRKDRTWKISFGTQELTPELSGMLSGFVNEFCYMALKVEPFKKDEKDIVESLQSELDFSGKSPGQRLRNVLYRLWEQDKEGYEDFNLYYNFQMEKIINHFKTKFDGN